MSRITLGINRPSEISVKKIESLLDFKDFLLGDVSGSILSRVETHFGGNKNLKYLIQT
jgi:hypothetical protein